MNTLENETALLDRCREALARVLGPDVPLRLVRPPKAPHDADLRIGTQPPLHLAVEAKTRVATRTQARHIILRLMNAEGDAIVLADWIPEPAAEELRKAGIFFADAQGNVFIRKPPRVVLDIRGRKPDLPPKAEPGRLIEPGGLKVVHYLLTHPRAAAEPLRTLAEGAGVGLATAHAAAWELERKQWLLPAAGGKRRFGDITGLVELFVRGYALKLRPACLLGRYRHQKRAPQEVAEAFDKRLAGAPCRWAITGGMAARHLTQYLEPDALALFVDDGAMEKLKAEPMLRDDNNGNITLLRLFGDAAVADRPRAPWPLATPLLTYAELLETGGPREVETAKMIFDQFLAPELAHGE